MGKKSLTAASVQRIKPPVKGQVEHFDLGFPGFALRVSYAGAKSWCFHYRIEGRLRRMNLGSYPAMSLIEARDAWRLARQSVAKGIDPSPRHSLAKADTFAEVAAEWLLRDQSKNKASTQYQASQLIKGKLLPLWGSRRIDEITARDIHELYDAITDSGAPAQASRAHSLLHRFFGWCVRRGILVTDPMRTIEKPGKTTERERVLTDAEIVSVWNATEHQQPYGAVARLLLLTGARREEITQLRVSEIDGDTIVLDGERTKSGKPHTIPLSSAARATLKSVPLQGGEFLFSNDDGKRPVTAWGHAKGKLDKLAKIEPWRLHDLRRTVATGLQRLGVNLVTIEAILGHVGSRAGIVGVYQRHSFDAEKRAALEAWGAHVMALVEGRETGKVVPFERSAS